MRLLQAADLLRRTCGDEGVSHHAHQRIANARGQLSVRKRPRAALAELHVGAHIEHARPPESLDRLVPYIDIITALQDERRKACTRKRQRGKHARRPKPHDDGPRLPAHRR